MNNSRFLAALLLALPLAAAAQTKSSTTKTTAAPAAGTQQVTEVTEDLDPATGKVIRRTTRTYTVPAGTAGSSNLPGRSAMPTSGTEPSGAKASDAEVSDFFREKTAVASLSGPGLLDAYARFMEKVHNERQGWKAADWATAASVLSTLNARYEQLRATLSLDDKLTIRSQQAEFQGLRTARQLSDQVSDKL
jgi:hypothetical protein